MSEMTENSQNNQRGQGNSIVAAEPHIDETELVCTYSSKELIESMSRNSLAPRTYVCRQPSVIIPRGTVKQGTSLWRRREMSGSKSPSEIKACPPAGQLRNNSRERNKDCITTPIPTVYVKNSKAEIVPQVSEGKTMLAGGSCKIYGGEITTQNQCQKKAPDARYEPRKIESNPGKNLVQSKKVYWDKFIGEELKSEEYRCVVEERNSNFMAKNCFSEKFDHSNIKRKSAIKNVAQCTNINRNISISIKSGFVRELINVYRSNFNASNLPKIQPAVAQEREDVESEEDHWEPEKPLKRQMSVAIQSGIVKETTKRYEERPKLAKETFLPYPTTHLPAPDNHFACIKAIFKGDDHKKDSYSKDRLKSENVQENFITVPKRENVSRSVNDGDMDSENYSSKFSIEKTLTVPNPNKSMKDYSNPEPSYYVIHNTIDGQVLLHTPPRSPPEPNSSEITKSFPGLPGTGVEKVGRDDISEGVAELSSSQVHNRKQRLDAVSEERNENSKSEIVGQRISNPLVPRMDLNSSSELISPGLLTSAVRAAREGAENSDLDGNRETQQLTELKLGSSCEETALVGATGQLKNSETERKGSERQKMAGDDSISLTIFNDRRYTDDVSSSNADELHRCEDLQHSQERTSVNPTETFASATGEKDYTPSEEPISQRNQLDAVQRENLSGSNRILSMNGDENLPNAITSCDTKDSTEESSVKNDPQKLAPAHQTEPLQDLSYLGTNDERASNFSLDKVEKIDNDLVVDENTHTTYQNEGSNLTEEGAANVAEKNCYSQANHIESSKDLATSCTSVEEQKQTGYAVDNFPSDEQLSPGGHQASRVKAYGDGLHSGVVGEENTFELDTSRAEFGELGVHVVGPQPDAVTNTAIFATDETADTLQVRYTAATAGLYRIYLTWDEHDIAGSPFLANVTEERMS